MAVLQAIGFVLSNYVFPAAILLFMLAVTLNMVRFVGPTRIQLGPAKPQPIDVRRSDPLALDIWLFLTRDRRWRISAREPRIVTRGTLTALDERLARAGQPISVPRPGGFPAQAYFMERLPAFLPEDTEVTVSQEPPFEVRVTWQPGSDFTSLYDPDPTTAVTTLYDECALFIRAVRGRLPKELPAAASR